LERFGATATEDLMLVRQCMAGDAAAWQRLVEYQHKRVYAICYRFTGSPSDAEDLTQEVFIKLYRNFAAFDGTKGSLQTWITTLTRNLLVDHFRRSRHERLTGSLDAGWDAKGEDESFGATPAERLADKGPTQFDHVAGQEVQTRVQAALQQLSPELREAVVLRDLEDMDYKEIAAVLNIPEGTVKSRISRGRAELARVLERTHNQGRGNATPRQGN
jgi:RNA polymerase sigma-70 factor (ECF subfamily)